MAFCSSTRNSPIQRRDIQCNAYDKGKRIGNYHDLYLPNFGMMEFELFKDIWPVIKKGNHEEVVKGTSKAEDAKRGAKKKMTKSLRRKA
ncbi:uncharacterized protein G2W53_037131 [Senna tora]|uniref:Uncharacterized protein n=1 Tax=Senna tora TaxID=362788 RepID=A0A834SVQ5_9FABA|nr:uncharacterized protein G2W53_037131 [Senna tora]